MKSNFKYVFIYESSSKGGCYEYSKCLLSAYQKTIPQTYLLIPSNAEFSNGFVKKILLADELNTGIKPLRKLHFLIRQFLNPLILFFFLITKKESLVILNDFEQLSAPLWAPLYRWFLKKHKLAVFLHDPDRDSYPPSKQVSEYCMNSMMKSMNIGLYHEFLPQKVYYNNANTSYVKVPHGLYEKSSSDLNLLNSLNTRRDGKKLMAILGNIRDEKNYTLAIKALSFLPDWKLIIAGAPANSLVTTEPYKQLATEIGVSDRVIWLEKFLSDSDLSTVIHVSDLILLYYKQSFTSQSGILNLIAPFQKKVLIADSASSLSEIGKRFNLGVLVKVDDLNALVEGIKCTDQFDNSGWAEYNAYASWDKQVQLVLNQLS